MSTTEGAGAPAAAAMPSDGDDRVSPEAAYARARAAGWADEAARRAAAEAARSPPPGVWRTLLIVAAAGLGAGLVASGIVTFFAYNWQRLGRAGRFGLLEAGLVAAAVFGARHVARLRGQIALSVGAVLIGVLLAVFGQTYQTGADAIDLFAGWAVLGVPFALAAMFEPLWLLLSFVAGTAAFLAGGQRDIPWDSRIDRAALAAFAVAAGALVLWELQAIRGLRAPLRQRWLPRTWGALAAIALSVAAVVVIVDSQRGSMAGPLAAVACSVGAVAYLYHVRRVDLFMQTAAAGLLLVVITTAAARALLEHASEPIAQLFVLAALVAAQVTAIVAWLRRELQRARAAPPEAPR